MLKTLGMFWKVGDTQVTNGFETFLASGSCIMKSTNAFSGSELGFQLFGYEAFHIIGLHVLGMPAVLSLPLPETKSFKRRV